MQRERPEYLPPIKPRRWGFPWMLAIGVTTVALAGFGLKQHLATQAAWNARFNKPKAVAVEQVPAVPAAMPDGATLERIRQIREAREQAELALKERASWRCINGTPFRKIPGGWENVVGERC